MSEKKEHSYEEIANVFDMTPSQARNRAKRAFNKVVDEMLAKNKNMSVLDVTLELMNLWDVDPDAIKSMLNQKNKALLCKELSDSWLLVKRGIISNEKYEKYTNTISKYEDDD